MQRKITAAAALAAFILLSGSFWAGMKYCHYKTEAKKQEAFLDVRIEQANEIVKLDTTKVPEIEVRYEKQIKIIEKVVDNCADEPLPNDIMCMYESEVCSRASELQIF